MLKKTLKGGFAPPALSTLSQFELLEEEEEGLFKANAVNEEDPEEEEEEEGLFKANAVN